MDVSALIAAGIGAAGGALAGGATAAYRNRLAVRSAARLIHAELTENTAAISYFIEVGIWPTTNVRHSAWDAYAETLSRMRKAAGFHTIQQGYSQLEGIAFLAQPSDDGTDLPESVRKEILEDAIATVRQAVREAGLLAGVEGRALEQQLEALQRRPLGPARQRAVGRLPSSIPAGILDRIARARVELEPEAAAGEGVSTVPGSHGSRVLSGLKRTVYDAGGQEALGPDLAVRRSEGDGPTGDVDVDKAYDALGSFYRFFAEVFVRDSIDDEGQPLVAVVHFGDRFPNMFWDGVRLVAGDGDGQIFERMTASEEMMAAELSHGVISSETPFQYMGQTGALTQSLGAIFGVLVKQFRLRQTVDEADWTLGADALAPTISGTALYSLAAPGTAYKDELLGTDPQPAHMSGYVQTDQDNGGVHVNSGIPSRAFYLVAKALGGQAWEQAGRIWYAAMRDPGLHSKSGFRRFARATVEAAEQLYGAEDPAVGAVRSAWEGVGVKPSQARTPAAAAAGPGVEGEELR